MKKTPGIFTLLMMAEAVKAGTISFKGNKKQRRKSLQGLFSLVAIIRHPVVIFDMPTAINDRPAALMAVYDGLKNNVSGYFTPAISDPTLADFLQLIEDYSDAIQAVTENKPNAVANRDAIWEEIFLAMDLVIAYVKGICRAKPANAQQIVGEVKMRLRISRGKGKQVYGATSKVAHEIEFTGEVWAKRQINDWQICRDISDERNWLLVKVTPSFAAKATIKNLESDTIYYVRQMVIIVGEEPEWLEPIAVKVK